MTDTREMLATLRRPRLLVRAARHGLNGYNRERDLRRVLRQPAAPSPIEAVEKLIKEEAALNETRKTGDAAYSVARHVDILIALMAESAAAALPERT